MLLAGNVYAQSMMTQSKLHMQAPASKVPAVDQPLVNQSMSTPPCSGLPSPMSVSSHPIGHCGVPGTNNDDIKVSKTAGMSPAHANKTEPSRVMSSVAASAIMSSGNSLLCHRLPLNLRLTIVAPNAQLFTLHCQVVSIHLCVILWRSAKYMN